MPANKKKDTIPQRNGATSNGVLPTHQPLLEDFHQYVPVPRKAKKDG